MKNVKNDPILDDRLKTLDMAEAFIKFMPSEATAAG
jgi:hypothetical protein